jgi:peptidyl-prolyl cis-trans isomerase SurA
MLLAELPMDTKPIVDKLKPGEVSAPSKTYTPDGRPIYRVIYLKSITLPHQANLIQDYGRIQLEAESRKKEKAIEDWLEKNRKGTYIRLHKGYINCPDMLRWENQ